MTSSKDLGEITLSTFRGEDGPLVKEVNKVLTWFKEQGSPDILFLSTIMLAGIGKVLKRELNIPVYGFLQGEDSFLVLYFLNIGWKHGNFSPKMLPCSMVVSPRVNILEI